MSKKTSGNKRKWYTVRVTVWRNSDGHILRDSQQMLIDGINNIDATRRAGEILTKVYNPETHTILVSLAEDMH